MQHVDISLGGALGGRCLGVLQYNRFTSVLLMQDSSMVRLSAAHETK